MQINVINHLTVYFSTYLHLLGEFISYHQLYFNITIYHIYLNTHVYTIIRKFSF